MSQSLIFNKVAGQFFKNVFFTEDLWTSAVVNQGTSRVCLIKKA